MKINPNINSHQTVLKHKGLIGLGEKVTDKSKYITFIFIKVIACLTVVGIIPAFLLINHYYKKVARCTIHNDNVIIIQNLFERQIPPSKNQIDALYAKRLIHRDKYIHPDDIDEIKTELEHSKRQEDLKKPASQLQREFLQHISEEIPSLAETYGLNQQLVELIINADGLTKDSYETRKEQLHEIQEIIENVDPNIVEKFLYENLTAENLAGHVEQLELVIDLLKKWEGNAAQTACARAFVIASSESLLANKDNPKLDELYNSLIKAACQNKELSFSEDNAEQMGRALAIPIEHQLLINNDNDYERAIKTVINALDPPLFSFFNQKEKQRNTTIIETIKHHI